MKIGPEHPVVTDSAGNSFELRPIDCPTCRRPAAKVLGLRGGEHHRYGLGIVTVIKRCDGCGLLFPDPFPYPLDAQRLYGDPDKYFERHDTDARVESYRAELRDVISMSRAGRSSSLLDVGSGRGELLRAARMEGLNDIVGLELSTAMIDHISENYGIKALAETVERHAATAGRTYDIVMLGAIIEHMYDPDEAMASIAQLAHTGTVLWVDTPNEPNLMTVVGNGMNRARGRSAVINLSPTFSPYHVFGFNYGSLSALLAKHGFVITRRRVWGWPDVPSSGGRKDRIAARAATLLNHVANRVGMGTNFNVWAVYEGRSAT